MPQLCYVFDLDGTLFNCQHRVHLITNGNKDWDAFHAAVHNDTPIEHMVELARNLGHYYPAVYTTGRSDVCHGATVSQLLDVGLTSRYLYMRKAGDYTPDDELKVNQFLPQIRADGFEPIMVFEDRTRVVNAWRAAGIPCAQVAPGDF